jgi:hypothetical protein
MTNPRQTPGLGLLAFWNLGAAGWKTGMDTNIRSLSALVHLSPLSRTTALPGTPTDGMIYIVPSNAGANPNEIALHDNAVWIYLVPLVGTRAYVRDTETFVVWDGTAWAAETHPAAITFAFAGTDVATVARVNFAGDGVAVEEAGGTVTVTVTQPAAGLADAPTDGSLYGRLDGVWVAVPESGGGGGIAEAPVDGGPYGRQSSVWVELPPPNGSAVDVLKESVEIQIGAIALNFFGAGVGVTSEAGTVSITIPGYTPPPPEPEEHGPVIRSYSDDATLSLDDAKAYVRVSKETAVALTVPTNASVAIPVRTQIGVIAAGAGKLSIMEAPGVTVNTPETRVLRKQFSSATLTKVSTDEWDLIGDLELVGV